MRSASVPQRLRLGIVVAVAALGIAGCGNSGYGAVPDVGAAVSDLPFAFSFREVKVGPDSQRVTVGRAVSGDASVDFVVAPHDALGHLPRCSTYGRI